MNYRITLFLTRATVALVFLMSATAVAQEYVLLGWNDLGMHCANQYFDKIAVLPPFNNVYAQLIEKSSGQLPRPVSSGFRIEYSIPNNSYSVGKTDFWTYAQQLFGLGSPLPANIGLTGKGLTGVLDSGGTYFSAHGIPVTPFADSDLVNETPFQLIHLVAKRISDGSTVASTDCVIPVSNEVGCVQSGCHSSPTSILNAHESVSGFNKSGPVLCAACHASNALGTTGNPEAMPFSFRIHSKHAGVAGPAMSISTCYKCHPGPKTQCLRDVMGKNPTHPLVCQNCHGTMDSVANSVLAGRRPWLDEPKCGKCHGATYAEETGKLYRQSVGHGGLFCSACHSSPHAILPTVQPNDNVQNIALQGYPGALRKCSVCHATAPGGPGPHGILDSVTVAPDAPQLALPLAGSMGVTTAPRLQWSAVNDPESYQLQLAPDSSFLSPAIDDSLVPFAWKDLSGLNVNTLYFWRVRARNIVGWGPWSGISWFTTGTGTTMAIAVDRYWNLVSLPLLADNPAVPALFPTAVTQAYDYRLEAYHVVDSLVPGPGYWLRFSQAQPVSVTGTPFHRDTIDIAAGWNLIGSISDSVPVGAITTVPAGILASPVFGYHSGYIERKSIMPGIGYWVKSSGSGKLIIASGILAKQTVPSLTGELALYDRLRVRDAEGSTQTLYLAASLPAGRSLADFEFPPSPPEGCFDVRFASNRMLELYSPVRVSDFPIAVSAHYPLTVEWDLHSTSPQMFLSTLAGKQIINGEGSVRLTSAEGLTGVTVAADAVVPSSFVLEQNYPNPFNPSTTFRYALPVDAHVRLTIYTTLGQKLATLVDMNQQQGYHEYTWTGDVAGGLYLYRLEAAGLEDPARSFTDVKKLVLMK